MRIRSVVLALAVLLASFAALPACKKIIPPGPMSVAKVEALLTDAQWGIEAGHWSGWLSDTDYFIASGIVVDAKHDVQLVADAGAMAAGRQALIDAEKRLPADNKIRPYLDWLITALGSS